LRTTDQALLKAAKTFLKISGTYAAFSNALLCAVTVASDKWSAKEGKDGVFCKWLIYEVLRPGQSDDTSGATGKYTFLLLFFPLICQNQRLTSTSLLLFFDK